MRGKESEIPKTLDLLDERACAYQKTLVFLRQAYPNAVFMTYDRSDEFSTEYDLLTKFVIGIGQENPRWITYQECTEETTADNIPGGLRSCVKTENGETFTATWYPLLFGDGTDAWEGAALLHIHSEVSEKFWLKFGNGNKAWMHASPNPYMAGDKIDCEEGCAQWEDDYVMITRKERPLITAVGGDFAQVHMEKLPETSEDCGTYAVAECKNHNTAHTGTDIYVVAAFSEDPQRARQLAGADPIEELTKVQKYYEQLLENWHLETPDPVLNEAFAHALLNVEYSWLYPYGWIESIQHWPLMWHMEHTAAEEWNGRYERVRSCLRTQMSNVFENGAIPDMGPNGKARRDWGGNNQFFLREVEHYVKMTGDIAFAAEAEPFLEKALKQTFREYDPAGSGIIGWGTQIGNQEDFESTPGKGAATGSEGVRMLEIMAYIKELLGKKEEAKRYARSADSCRTLWYRTLWLRDVGRPAWYVDVHGEKHLETTYHGIIYPILYDQIDDADKVSALDHLRHRLSGPEGEIYQSNHFADHLYDGVPTWGMQCGSDMQPFATAAYASVGMKKEAVEPLAFIARRVCGDFQRGAWPETANETRFAYFSPSAAVFSQGIIESVFGLKKDLPANITTVTPAIPQDWPGASLRLPGVELAYTNLTNGFTLRIRIDDDTVKKVKVLCPPSFRVTAKTSQDTWMLTPKQHCGWSSAEFELGTGRDITVSCTWEPIEIHCDAPAVCACGQPWSVSVSGDAELVGVDDRCNVLGQLEWRQGRIDGVLRPDLLEPYEPYGWFGRANFARRMIYLRLKAAGQSFLYPCPVTVLPAVYAKAKVVAPEKEIRLEVYNQTQQELTGQWQILCQNNCLSAEGTVPGRQMGILRFPLENADITFSPGKNRAMLTGPVQYAVEIEADAPEARVIPLPLPGDAVRPAEYWKEIGLFPSHGHMKNGPEHYMENLWEQEKEIDILPNVPLRLDPRGFVPFSREKHPVVTVALEGRKIKKLYLLCSTFIDNHSVFSKVLHIEAQALRKDAFFSPILHYDCYFPGDLDMGFGDPVIFGFATYRNGVESDPVPELPLNPGDTDYAWIQPPSYPQRTLWRKGPVAQRCNTIFNLLELDFGEFREMQEVRIYANTSAAAGGIFALAAHSEACEPSV